MVKAKENKTEVNLITIGTGVIFFGLWTFIKFMLSYFLADDRINNNDSGVIYVFTFVFALFLAFLHCYIGLSARAEGNGKKKSPVYIVVAGILVFLINLFIVIEIFLIFTSEFTFSLIISVIIDTTSMVFLVELIVNSIKIRQIRKQSAREESYER